MFRPMEREVREAVLANVPQALKLTGIHHFLDDPAERTLRQIPGVGRPRRQLVHQLAMNRITKDLRPRHPDQPSIIELMFRSRSSSSVISRLLRERLAGKAGSTHLRSTESSCQRRVTRKTNIAPVPASLDPHPGWSMLRPGQTLKVIVSGAGIA